MLRNIFSKTKRLDKLLKEYNQFYSQFEDSISSYNVHLNDFSPRMKKHLGDSQELAKDLLFQKDKEFRNTFGFAFENTFEEILVKHPDELIKWLKEENNFIPKYVSTEFKEKYRDFLTETSPKKYEIKDISTKENIFVKKLRDFFYTKEKYQKQLKNLNFLNGEKKVLLEKANKKTLEMIKRQEDYINFYVDAFNQVLELNILKVKYKIKIDHEKEMDVESYSEIFRFMNMICNLLDSEDFGYRQKYLKLFKIEELEKHNLDISTWQEDLEGYNLTLVA